MKRILYGTWTQINHVIKQNNEARLVNNSAGYEYYEVEPALEEDFPVRNRYDLVWPQVSKKMSINSYPHPAFDEFINYNQMYNPRTVVQQFAKRTNTEVEYFKITLYN